MMGIIGLRPAYQAWLPANIQSVFGVSYSFHAPDITPARNRNPYEFISGHRHVRTGCHRPDWAAHASAVRSLAVLRFWF